jgi:hypothetical protein
VVIIPIDLVLAAPQPTKSFEECSVKMRTITNILNKKYCPLQFFSDGASAAAGGNFHFWTISCLTRSEKFGYLCILFFGWGVSVYF